MVAPSYKANIGGVSSITKFARNTAIDPTGVVLCNSVDKALFLHKEINVDMLVAQTLEGYVLPLLPAVPLHIHNIHLKCEIKDDSTSCYQLLQLPSYKKM